MDDFTRALEAITEELPLIKYRLDEPMKGHTSFQIGGRARLMFFPDDTGELVKLHSLLRKYDVAALTLGNGTNVLINDRPLELAVIKTTGLSAITLSGENEITAEAGAPLTRLSEFAQENGLTGLEFIYGIPGSLGGAVSMNAGAYGMEMKDAVRSTAAYNHENGIYTAVGGEHGFSYRSSRFSNAGDVVLSSVIGLRKDNKDSIKVKMDGLNHRRRESQPLDLPNAGSTFKRPKEGYAASLIEQAGLKGYTVGGAQVSEKHSGFIVNRGGAVFSDVLRLIEYIQETVLSRFGVELEPEVKIIR